MTSILKHSITILAEEKGYDVAHDEHMVNGIWVNTRFILIRNVFIYWNCRKRCVVYPNYFDIKELLGDDS